MRPYLPGALAALISVSVPVPGFAQGKMTLQRRYTVTPRRVLLDDVETTRKLQNRGRGSVPAVRRVYRKAQPRKPAGKKRPARRRGTARGSR